MKKIIILTTALSFSCIFSALAGVSVKDYKIAYIEAKDTVMVIDPVTGDETYSIVHHPKSISHINGVAVKSTNEKLPLQYIRNVYADMQTQKLAQDLAIKNVVVNDKNEIVYFEMWQNDKNVSDKHAQFINKHCQPIHSDSQLFAAKL